MEKRLKNFQQAIAKLEEVVKLPKNEIVRDSAIMRFQFIFDLCWKVLKDHLDKKGIECYSPRDCFKGGFSANLIEYNDSWLAMIDDRNNISHIYNEEIAEKVYSHLLGYLELFQLLEKKLSSQEKLPLE